jgi:hypothetical protein
MALLKPLCHLHHLLCAHTTVRGSLAKNSNFSQLTRRLLLLLFYRPSVVFTCLALFNVLIAPLNAFPWVVNGVVEAFVSLRRIQAYLLLPQRSNEWAYAEDVLPQIQEFQQQQKLQQDNAQQQQQGHVALLAGGATAQKHGQHSQQQQQQQLSSKTAGKGQQGSSDSSSKQVPQRGGAAAVLERGVVAQFDTATFAWKQVRQQVDSQLFCRSEACRPSCCTAP